MKRSKPLRFAVPVLVAVLAMSSCSLLRVKTEVAAKSVAVDLTFGAVVPKQPTPTIPELPTLPVPTLTIEPPGDGDLCPDGSPKPCAPSLPPCPEHANAISARDESPNVLTRANVPQSGLYAFHFEGFYEGDDFPYSYDWETMAINDVNNPDDGDDFSFTYEESVTGIKWYLRNVAFREQDETQAEGTAGLFLDQIDIPTQTGGAAEALVFSPQPPLQLLIWNGVDNPDGGLAPGQKFSSSGTDNGQKPTGVPGVTKPSANKMTSEVTVGDKEDIEVCAELANAWKVTWALTIGGEMDWTLAGTFWLDLAYGGWPVKAEWAATNDAGSGKQAERPTQLMAGSFASNLMLLDPVDQL